MKSDKYLVLEEEYRRARRNYLRRVNRLVKMGYQVDVIKIPKKIKPESIARLIRERGDVIKRKSTLVDMLTGQAYEKTRSKRKTLQRKDIEKVNRVFSKLSPMEQQISFEQSQIIHIPKQDLVLSRQESYELLIDNWYTAIEGFRPDIYLYLLSKTNELLEGASEETRRRFAYVYQQNPDIFPEAGDSDRRIINAKFDQIRNMMNWASDSEAYKDFISKFDEVEDE